MISIDRLKICVREGLAYLKKLPDVKEAEIFASCNTSSVSRLNYTSHIPCNGVEEPKSTESYGLCILVSFKTGEGPKTGFGSESASLSMDGIKRALDKARRNAAFDPDFQSLPSPHSKKNSMRKYHDEKLIDLQDSKLVSLGWNAIKGAIQTYKDSPVSSNIIIGGDITLLSERIAVGSTKGIADFDESTLIMASITSMCEQDNTKGSGWTTATSLKDFFPEEAGKEAAAGAISTIRGKRIKDGEYNVILGRQPVTDLLNNIILPSLDLSMISASSSVFLGMLGKYVSSKRLTIYDDGRLKGGLAAKKITDEGLSTGRTNLISKGKLVGFLSNNYYSKKIMNDTDAEPKLGVSPKRYRRSFVPRNGFRFESGGGRSYMQRTGIYPTNVVVDTTDNYRLNDLLRLVKNGIYIGRIWYTYPTCGLGPGDFTSTVVGDSYIVENGKIAAPLAPNTVRMDNNIKNILHNIIGITRDKRETLVWAADEVVHAPEMAVAGVRLFNIGKN